MFFNVCQYELSASSFALGGSSVVSTTKILAQMSKTMAMLKEQLSELQDLKHKAEQTVRVSEDILDAAQGHYDYGTLLNDWDMFQQSELASPSTWSDAMHHAESWITGEKEWVNPDGSDWINPDDEPWFSLDNDIDYSGLFSDYHHNHPRLDEETIALGTSKATAQNYIAASSAEAVYSVQSEYAFNHASDYVETVHSLSESINKTDNLKAATDLNSRLIAELATIEAQKMKLEAMQNTQLAGESELRLQGIELEALFNQPDEDVDEEDNDGEVVHVFE